MSDEKPQFCTGISKKPKGDKHFIQISREELFQLHDIADKPMLLRDIAQEAPEPQLIQAEVLIKKTLHWALESNS